MILEPMAIMAHLNNNADILHLYYVGSVMNFILTRHDTLGLGLPFRLSVLEYHRKRPVCYVVKLLGN